jgi:uncharacterized protein
MLALLTQFEIRSEGGSHAPSEIDNGDQAEFFAYARPALTVQAMARIFSERVDTTCCLRPYGYGERITPLPAPFAERTSQQRKRLTLLVRKSRGNSMRDFRDAKAMAQTLRDALKAKSISLTHSESLELIARTLGLQDWNVLSAAIQASEPAAKPGKTGVAMPVAAMRDVVFFPQVMTSIFVGRDKTKRAIEAAMAGERQLFVVTQRQPGDDDPDFAALHSIGVTAEILERLEFSDGNWRVKVSCTGRAAIVRPRQGDYLAADIAPIEETRTLTVEAFAQVREILDAYEGYAKAPTPAYLGLYRLEPGVFADVAVQLLKMGIDKTQEMLEISDVVTRLETILAWMKAGSSSA